MSVAILCAFLLSAMLVQTQWLYQGVAEYTLCEGGLLHANPSLHKSELKQRLQAATSQAAGGPMGCMGLQAYIVQQWCSRPAPTRKSSLQNCMLVAATVGRTLSHSTRGDARRMVSTSAALLSSV